MRRFLLLACLVVPSLVVPSLAAAQEHVQKIAADASVHRIDVQQAGKPVVPVLLHTVTRPDGGVDTAIVTGTGDAAVERDPVLEIDPATDTPILVWSRNSGTGFDLWISRFEQGAWSEPQSVVTMPGADDVDPQVRIGARYIHLVARREMGIKVSYVRVSLDLLTLAPVFGPETLATEVDVLLEGGSSPAPDPTDLHFVSQVLRSSPLDPGRVVVWGVRDEPVPIDFIQVLELPSGLLDLDAPDIGWIEGTLSVWGTSPTHVWYSTYLNGTWTVVRAAAFDPGTSPAEARLLLEDLIRRESR